MPRRAAAVDGIGGRRGADGAQAEGEGAAGNGFRGLAGGRVDGLANYPRGARGSDADYGLETADGVFRAASVL